VLRYGIPYGPRMRSDLVVAAFLERALRGGATHVLVMLWRGAADLHGAATESERCQLPTCDDAVLPFRQRPNLPFALESLGATPTMRVRLTMHGNVKDTRNRIRP